MSYDEGLWEARVFAVAKLLLTLKGYNQLSGKTVVFVNSVLAADTLCDDLYKKAPSLLVRPFHKDVPGPCEGVLFLRPRAPVTPLPVADAVRQETLRDFEDGIVDVIVATDLLSRGIDTTFVRSSLGGRWVLSLLSTQLCCRCLKLSWQKQQTMCRRFCIAWAAQGA